MKEHALVLASLAADSLALGPHWIYDTEKIDREFGRVTTLQSPLADSFHKNRKRGEFTHYGDQTFLLLKSIHDHKGFELAAFANDWYEMMSGYDGYLDKATRETLHNLKDGNTPSQAGSTSSDLGGAARIAPLVYRYHNDLDRLVGAVREQTSLTHNNGTVLAGAQALARITHMVLKGTSPREAVSKVIDAGIDDLDLDMKMRGGLDSMGKNTKETIRSFGQACGIAAAMPGVIHLIVTYEEDYETAMIENVMAGGDSAARGLAAGMVLGAHLGVKAIPSEWLTGMHAYERITAMLGEKDS